MLDLTWSIDCISAILNSAKISINPAAVLPVLDLPKGCTTDATFEMNIARLYVSVVTLSKNDTTKFKKNLKSRRFKSTISWNGYRSEITTEPENNLSCMIDPAFRSFFSIWVFFHGYSGCTGQQGKEEGIYVTPFYHFHLLHRQLDIIQTITAKSSPLHIASSWTRTGNKGFSLF